MAAVVSTVVVTAMIPIGSSVVSVPMRLVTSGMESAETAAVSLVDEVATARSPVEPSVRASEASALTAGRPLRKGSTRVPAKSSAAETVSAAEAGAAAAMSTERPAGSAAEARSATAMSTERRPATSAAPVAARENRSAPDREHQRDHHA